MTNCEPYYADAEAESFLKAASVTRVRCIER